MGVIPDEKKIRDIARYHFVLLKFMYYFYLDMFKTFLARGITTKESKFSLFHVCILHFKIFKFQKVLKTIAI